MYLDPGSLVVGILLGAGGFYVALLSASYRQVVRRLNHAQGAVRTKQELN